MGADQPPLLGILGGDQHVRFSLKHYCGEKKRCLSQLRNRKEMESFAHKLAWFETMTIQQLLQYKYFTVEKVESESYRRLNEIMPHNEALGHVYLNGVQNYQTCRVFVGFYEALVYVLWIDPHGNVHAKAHK